FWTAWAASTERPGTEVTYTNNWPHEPLVGNKPSTNNVIWSVVSVVLLLAGIAFLAWGWAFTHREEPGPQAPASDRLLAAGLTPSPRALRKYLLMVVGLFLFRILLGGFTAHYT